MVGIGRMKSAKAGQAAATVSTTAGKAAAGTGKPLTKAQAYAMASMLAQQQQQQQQQQTGQRPPVYPSQPSQQQQLTAQQQQLTAARRKQRVITPQMVKPRPIERRHNIMMRSKHNGGASSRSGDSVTDSVNTEATEHVTNNQRANARRKRRTEKKPKKKEFVPTLETVNTLESKTAWHEEGREPGESGTLQRAVMALSAPRDSPARRNSFSSPDGPPAKGGGERSVSSDWRVEYEAREGAPQQPPVAPVDPPSSVVRQNSGITDGRALYEMEELRQPLRPEPEREVIRSLPRAAEKKGSASPSVLHEMKGLLQNWAPGASPKETIHPYANQGAASTRSADRARRNGDGPAAAARSQSVGGFAGIDEAWLTTKETIDPSPVAAVPSDIPHAVPKSGNASTVSSLHSTDSAARAPPHARETRSLFHRLFPPSSAASASFAPATTTEATKAASGKDSTASAPVVLSPTSNAAVQGARAGGPAAPAPSGAWFAGWFGAKEAPGVEDADGPPADLAGADAASAAGSRTSAASANGKPPCAKMSSLLTVATYALSDGARPQGDGGPETEGPASPGTVKTDCSKDDSLVTEAEIALAPATEADAAAGEKETPGRAAANSVSSAPHGAPLRVRTGTDASVQSDTRMFRHVATPSGRTSLTIHTDVLSPARPSSVISPAHKEETEVQLPPPQAMAQKEKETISVAAKETNEPPPAASTMESLDAMVERSNARMDELKKQLIALARPDAPPATGGAPPILALEELADDPEPTPPAMTEPTPPPMEVPEALVRTRSPDPPARKLKKTVGRIGDGMHEKRAAARSQVKALKSKSKRREKGKKPKTKKTFMGKRSKVIEEEREYAPAEEERDDLAEAVREVEEREGAEEKRRPPAHSRRHPAPREDPPSEDGSRDLSMKSTLRDAECVSVESSVSLDREAFAHRPGLVERTASFVKNPARTLHRKRSNPTATKAQARARAREEELAQRMREGRTHARNDNRKKEEFSEGGHPVITDIAGRKQAKVEDDETSDGTDFQPEEMEQVHQLLVHDATIEEVIVEKEEEDERGVTFAEGDSMYVDNMVGAGHGVQQDQGAQTSGHDEADDSQDVLASMGTGGQGKKMYIMTGNETIESLSSYPVVHSAPSKEIPTPQTADAQIKPEDLAQPNIYRQGQGDASFLVGGDSLIDPTAFLIEPSGSLIEVAAPTLPRQSSGNEGSLSNMMESMGLFGASVCMGTSKAMLSCVDTCSDTPHQRAQQRLSSLDNEFAERVRSPRNQTVMVMSPEAQANGSIFRCGRGTTVPEEEKKMTKEETEEIVTRALTSALSNLEQERGMASPRGLASPRGAANQPQADEEDAYDAHTHWESVDGRYVPPHLRGDHQKKRVPRKIALKAKRGEHHRMDMHGRMNMAPEEEEYEEEPPELQRTPSLKRTGSKSKKEKGVKGFLRKLSKVRVGLTYEL